MADETKEMTIFEASKKLERGEIDELDFYHLFDVRMNKKVDWSKVSWEGDGEEKEEKEENHNYGQDKKKACKRNNTPNFFRVKIRLSDGRVFEVTKVPIQNRDFMHEEETELFNRYYSKLSNKYFHIQNPGHRAFKTTNIDELFIEVTDK